MGSNSIVRALPRLGLAVLVAGMVGGAGAASSSRAAATWQWYKADVHVHSSGVSPDAAQDLGVMSNAAKAQGLNAVFLTDHGAGSNQPIANAIVNHIAFDDAFNYWKTATYGTLTSTAPPTLGTPPPGAASGSTSLHLTASSAGYGESITWYKRGPNLRSGDLILRFSVYPVRIDPGSGAYVSLAIGGDSTLRDATGTGCDSTSGKGGPPNGYTTSAGVISPGKSNVFVWQLGTPRAPSSDPNARVFTQQLSYTPNTWNTYTINVTQALNQIPAADRPDDYNGLEALKMVAAASGGTADAYFDNYHLDASTPVPSGNEFVYRNSIVHRYDTSTFKTFPGLEAGSSQHATRFDYDITDPSQYSYYSTGPPSILPTQQSGYPAQLDHPAFPGGVSQAAAVANNAYGADLMEAVPRGGNEAMITTLGPDPEEERSAHRHLVQRRSSDRDAGARDRDLRVVARLRPAHAFAVRRARVHGQQLVHRPGAAEPGPESSGTVPSAVPDLRLLGRDLGEALDGRVERRVGRHDQMGAGRARRLHPTPSRPVRTRRRSPSPWRRSPRTFAPRCERRRTHCLR